MTFEIEYVFYDGSLRQSLWHHRHKLSILVFKLALNLLLFQLFLIWKGLIVTFVTYGN